MATLDRYHKTTRSSFSKPDGVAFYNIQPRNKQAWELQQGLDCSSKNVKFKTNVMQQILFQNAQVLKIGTRVQVQVPSTTSLYCCVVVGYLLLTAVILNYLNRHNGRRLSDLAEILRDVVNVGPRKGESVNLKTV